jgi:hypothetical protein
MSRRIHFRVTRAQPSDAGEGTSLAGPENRSSLQSMSMAVEPLGSAQVHVTLDQGSAHFELRFYGSEEFTVPAWWIGVFDAKGELRRTEVLPSIDRRPEDVRRWMEPITGPDVAGRLIRLAIEAIVAGRRGHKPGTPVHKWRSRSRVAEPRSTGPPGRQVTDA